MLLAKIAMDTEAKKYKNGIAKWTYEDIEEKLWTISPLSKVWGIGSRMEKRLNRLGIYTIGELAHYDKNKLKDKFGIIGEELWEHANGIDNSIIKDFNKETKDKSFSHSQVLLKDYYNEDILLIVREMLDVITRRLRDANLESSLIGFGLSYSKAIGGGFYHSMKLEQGTDLTETLYPYCVSIFESFYEENMPIRKVSLAVGTLREKKGVQLNLFETPENTEKKEILEKAVDEVTHRFGKNSLLKASSLLEYSTAKKRNQKIGGHHE